LKAGSGGPDRRVLLGLIAAFAGILIALLGRMMFHLEAVTLTGVLMTVFGMFWIAATPFLRRSRPPGYAAQTPQPEILAAAEITRKLKPVNDIDMVPASVTEGTTELLKVPVRDRADPDDTI